MRRKRSLTALVAAVAAAAAATLPAVAAGPAKTQYGNPAATMTPPPPTSPLPKHAAGAPPTLPFTGLDLAGIVAAGGLLATGGLVARRLGRKSGS